MGEGAPRRASGGMHLSEAAVAVTCLLMAWASASDLRTRTIPNACSVGGAALMFAVSIFAGIDVTVLVVAVGATAALFGGAALRRPGSFGAGDAKLAVLVAAAMGPPAVVAIVLGLGLALAWCVVLSASGATRSLAGMSVPLAPFLAVGVAVALALAG